jgi:hypothetical protein
VSIPSINPANSAEQIHALLSLSVPEFAYFRFPNGLIYSCQVFVVLSSYLHFSVHSVIFCFIHQFSNTGA